MKAGRKRCGVDGKFSYPTFELAVHAALVSNKRRGDPLRVYDCAVCSGFHLTRNPGNPAVATVPPPFTPTDLARILNRQQEAS
jgi:hypothetical protein